MNDKIKKLAERAFEESSKELAVTDPARWYSDKGPDIDIVFEKFAELIIQECARDFDNTYMSGGKTMGDYIRQKFGVEE
jgi:hypothetical protein